MDRFKYYLKRVGRCFLFSHYVMFMTVMISLISLQFFTDMKSRTLALIIEIAALLFYAFTEIIAGMAFGGRQYKTMRSNVYRRTPDARDLLGYYELRDKEYAPANGFIAGAISHYPLAFFFLLYALTKGRTQQIMSTLAMGSTAALTAPLYQIFPGANPLWLSLAIVPLTSALVGVGYLLGAWRIKAMNAGVERMEAKLSAEDNEPCA